MAFDKVSRKAVESPAARIGWAVLSAVCILTVLVLCSGLLARRARNEAEARYGLTPPQVIEIGDEPGNVLFKTDPR